MLYYVLQGCAVMSGFTRLAPGSCCLQGCHHPLPWVLAPGFGTGTPSSTSAAPQLPPGHLLWTTAPLDNNSSGSPVFSGAEHPQHL